MARSASRVLACVLLALACSAMLCFVGTTPSPAAGSTALKQSLRAPAVQMEARGGGEGALGDMSPDTYIIGITVFGIASLFANISGFFNPWEDMRRPESGSGHDIEVFSLLTSEGSICCPWQSRLPCDLGRHSVFEGTNVDRRWACFPCWHVLLAVGPGFGACLFGLQKLQPKESHFGEEDVFICCAWSHVSIAGCEILGWPWLIIPNSNQFKTYMGVSVLFLSSLYSHRTPRWFWLQLISAWPLWRPLLCSSLCSKTCNMARSASRVLACVLLALACSAMLCFVGTTPSPAAGSTPLKQSLRAPAVQMEARGGGEGALGDMSPDTYIIGITVFGIASLFANISGFFNPWEDMRRPESGSGHDIEVFSLLTSEGSICCPWQSRSPCDLGRHSVFEGTNVDRHWACFPCWHVLLAVGHSGSRVQCMFVWTAKASAKGIPFWGRRDVICCAWSHVSIAGCEILGWSWLIIPNSNQFKTYMGVSVLFLSSLYSHRTPRWFWLQLISAWPLWRPLLCSSLCGKTCNMARSASRVLACVLLALACSAMLCFVGTTPSPAAGSTPLKQSLRAPAVQMEARGGGEGALGDMSPDTYIIGITVFGIASLFANISGFFNPWEDMRRPESGSGHDIEVFSLLTSEGSICCPWQSRSPCDLGRHSVFEGTNVDRRWACFPCWHFLLAVGPGFSACLFGLQKLQPKESHFGEEEMLFVAHDHMWASQDVRYLGDLGW